MKIVSICCLLCMMVLAAPAPAEAKQKKAKKGKTKVTKVTKVTEVTKDAVAKKADTSTGICQYNAQASSTKTCKLTEAVGEIVIKMMPFGQVYVESDLPLLKAPAPDETFMQVQQMGTNTLSLTSLRSSIPEAVVTVIRTRHSSTTVRFEVVKSNPDTQVRLVHQGYEERDAYCEQQIESAVEKAKADYKDRHAKLSLEVTSKARKLFLQAMATGETDLGPPGGDRRNGQNFVTLHAASYLRVGKSELSFLTVIVENIDSETFVVDKISAWIAEKNTKTALDVGWVCDSPSIAGHTKSRCVIDLGLPSTPTRKQRLGIRVQNAGSARFVELTNLDVR